MASFDRVSGGGVKQLCLVLEILQFLKSNYAKYEMKHKLIYTHLYKIIWESSNIAVSESVMIKWNCNLDFPVSGVC